MNIFSILLSLFLFRPSMMDPSIPTPGCSAPPSSGVCNF